MAASEWELPRGRRGGWMAGVLVVGVAIASVVGGVLPDFAGTSAPGADAASSTGRAGPSTGATLLALAPVDPAERRAQAETAAHVVLTSAGREVVSFRSAAEAVARSMAQRKAAEDAAAAQAAAAQAAAAQAAAAQAAAGQQAEAQARAAADAQATPAPRRATTATAQPVAAPAPTTTAAPPPPPPAPAPAAVSAAVDSSAEARFLSLVNDARTQIGLGPLALNGNLRASAEGWAAQLASDGSLHHQNVSQFLGPWSTAGENIAFGPSVDSMFKALMASPQHYANITKPDFTAIGIGVVVGPDGRLWTSHVFAG